MDRNYLSVKCCLDTALNPAFTRTSRERHKTLELVANNCPQVIEDRIEKFEETIRLLREYLPEAKPAK